MRIARLPSILRSAFAALSARERAFALLCAAAMLGGVVWGVLALVASTTSLVPAPGGTLRTGVVGQPRFVLPILAQTNDVDMDLSRLLYSGLLTITEDGALAGDLATSVDVSPDGKTYTAHLREGVRWHDGEPFTSDDVLLTVRLVQDPAVKSPLAPAFQGVDVTNIDDRTVQFTLKEPYAPFLYTLTLGILPAHVWADVPPSGIALAEHALRPVGTGPFRFEKLKRAEFSGEIREYRLARAPSSHGSAPWLEGLVFKFFPTTDDFLRALRRGEVDGASFLPPSLVTEAERIQGVRVARLHIPQVFAVFLHQAKNLALSDPAVRRALATAVDRERLIRDALHGEGAPAVAAIPEGSIGHLPDLATIAFDPERAKQNLAEAGWTDENQDGLREKDGTPLRFTLAATDVPEYLATANLLAEQWRAIGAEVVVQPATVGTMQAEILRPRNYEALLYGQVLGADPDPYPFWHSTQTRDPGLNLALFKDRASDRLLEQARQTTAVDERGALYRQFQERLIEEVPAIFLFSPTYAYAVPERLRGTFLGSAPLPADRFAKVSTWYLKTKRVRRR